VQKESYLEPLLAATVAALVVACALVHPYHNGALLMGPLRPYRLDLPTRSNLGNEIGGCAAVAHDLSVGYGHGGVVVGPLTLDGLGRRGRRKPGVSVIRFLAAIMVDGENNRRTLLTLGMLRHRSRNWSLLHELRLG
jgi:hypothetical protein